MNTSNYPSTKLSWAEMAAIDDEYEEQEMMSQQEQDEKIKNITAYRIFLFSIGKYDLEDGEIFE